MAPIILVSENLSILNVLDLCFIIPYHTCIVLEALAVDQRLSVLGTVQIHNKRWCLTGSVHNLSVRKAIIYGENKQKNNAVQH